MKFCPKLSFFHFYNWGWNPLSPRQLPTGRIPSIPSTSGCQVYPKIWEDRIASGSSKSKSGKLFCYTLDIQHHERNLRIISAHRGSLIWPRYSTFNFFLPIFLNWLPLIFHILGII